MSESHFVARTAPDQSHFNTLVLRMMWTVVIYIDAPGEQEEGRDFGDSYQLLSDDGVYDRTLSREEAVREDAQRLALRFTEVIPQGTYSLYHRLGCGVEFPVFLDVPFANLEAHGEEAEKPETEDWEPPVLTSEPELLSGDPLLLHHEEDHAVPELVADWAPPEESASDPASDAEAIA